MSRDFPVFGLVIESLGLFIFVTLYVPIKKKVKASKLKYKGCILGKA